MADAIKRHGSPTQAKYTPTAAAVAAGQVVPLVAAGLTCGVATLAIEQNKEGALDIGGGIYEMINLDNAPNGTKVYFDNATKKATTTVGSNALFGYIVEGGAGGVNSVCGVYHHPFA